MLIGVIADDFTGASDVANTLAKGLPPQGGLRTAQDPRVVLALKFSNFGAQDFFSKALRVMEHGI